MDIGLSHSFYHVNKKKKGNKTSLYPGLILIIEFLFVVVVAPQHGAHSKGKQTSSQTYKSTEWDLKLRLVFVS